MHHHNKSGHYTDGVTINLTDYHLLTAQGGDGMINTTAHSLPKQRRPGSMPLRVA